MKDDATAVGVRVDNQVLRALERIVGPQTRRLCRNCHHEIAFSKDNDEKYSKLGATFICVECFQFKTEFGTDDVVEAVVDGEKLSLKEGLMRVASKLRRN